MQNENMAGMQQQRLVCENRERLELSGVREVLTFSEERVSARTELGEFTVTGASLHLDKLSLEAGELRLNGRIDSMVFTDDKKGSFLSRLFG